MGDDGSVGRGNRCNGLITPNRPMSMEATSGKNPINHIGKIYNLLSTQIARECVTKVDGIEEMLHPAALADRNADRSPSGGQRPGAACSRG